MARARSLLLLTVLLSAGACRTVEDPQLDPSWPAERAAEPLTHADCVRLAASWAPNAAAWTARHAAARAALEQAGRFANPQLEASWEDFQVAGATGIPVVTTLSLMASLEDLASLGARKRIATHELEAEEAALRAEFSTLSRAVRASYDELVSLRARAALEDELVGVASAQRDAVVRFVQSGERPALELQRAEAELAQARASARAAQDAARIAELELCFGLGFERPVRLDLAEGATGEHQPPPPCEADDLLAEAASARPELAAARSRYAAERERCQLAAERVRFLPSLSAGPRFEDGETRGVASLGVELPLFDAGGAALRLQDAQLVAAAAELRMVAHAVGRDVILASARERAARSFLEQHARALATQRSSLRESAERLFAAGEADHGALIQARRDELEARRTLLDAEREAAATRLELEAALGRLSATRS